MTERTDIHRPAEFDPADYEVIDYIDNRPPPVEDIFLGALTVGDSKFAADAAKDAREQYQARVFEHFPNWKTGGTDHTSIFQCNHCGNPNIRWVAVVLHKPTGKKLAFGEQCAERVGIPGRDAFRAKFIKDRAAREQARLERIAREEAFKAENQDVIDYLAAFENDEDNYNDFLFSLSDQLRRKGELSEAQVEAVRRSIRREQEFQARKDEEAKWAAEHAETFKEGRLTVTGEIVSTKIQHGNYGSQLKMLVKLSDGNKVWGTVPGSLEDLTRTDHVWNEKDEAYDLVEGIELKGKRVEFTAKFERSHDDEHFGFFSRPTGAKLIEQETLV